MIAEHGSPEGWQEAVTQQWIGRLAAQPDDSMIDILDGQVRPAVVDDAFSRHRVQNGKILLLDCTPEMRDRRLRNDRGQPELATTEMACWAAYLRGQADALRLPVLDTTLMSVAEAVARLRLRPLDSATTAG
jgi:hypothetical protein